MEHLVVCVMVWTLTFVLIPTQRIRELWPLIIISLVWMFLLDNLSAYLGYYTYEHTWVPVGRASLFQLLACSGIGMLMINWLEKEPITKLISIISVAMSFSVIQFIYFRYGAFEYGSFDAVISFIYSIAALSVFVWLSLAIVGESKIYTGKKTSDIMKEYSY